MVNYELDQFANDPAKAESRDFQLEKILDTWPEESDRERLKVVFLTGPSLAEADQIYIRAGIRPENIYGVEMEAEPYAFAVAENDARRPEDRINLVHGNVNEFLSSEKQYDIISLDYTSCYSMAIIRTLDEIFDVGRESFSDESLLFMNTQASRESIENQWRLVMLNASSHYFGLSDLLHESKLGWKDLGKKREMCDQALELIDIMTVPLIEMVARRQRPKHLKLIDFAREGLYEEVNLRARYPLFRNLEMDELKAVLPQGEHFEPEVADAIGGNTWEHYYDFMFREYKDRLAFYGDDSFKDVLKLVVFRMLGVEVFYNALGNKIQNPLHQQLDLSAFMFNRCASSVPSEHDTFRYVSKSRTPMMMHYFRINRRVPNTLLDIMSRSSSRSAKRTLNYFNVLKRIRTGRQPQYSRFRRALKSLDMELDEFGVGFLSEPNNDQLVRSYRAGQELISAFNAFRSDPEYIALFFDMQRCIRYSPDPFEPLLERLEPLRLFAQRVAEHGDAVFEDIPVISNEPVKKKPLSAEDKDTIRELHREGCEPKDIHALFPESDVTLHQIRSICAWNKIYEKREQALSEQQAGI